MYHDPLLWLQWQLKELPLMLLLTMLLLLLLLLVYIEIRRWSTALCTLQEAFASEESSA
jgi:hypothetical protein